MIRTHTETEQNLEVIPAIRGWAPVGLLPVSMMVGQVFMFTDAAASLERRILMRFCVVRMHAALLTWQKIKKTSKYDSYGQWELLPNLNQNRTNTHTSIHASWSHFLIFNC